MLFGITTEWCSASDRNRVHLRPDSPPATIVAFVFIARPSDEFSCPYPVTVVDVRTGRNGPFCGKSKRVSEDLLGAGFTNVRRYQLGIPVWRALGGITQIEAEGAQYVLQDDHTAVWLDTRAEADVLKGSLPGAKRIDLEVTRSGKDNPAMQKAKNNGTLPIEDHNTRIIVFGDNQQTIRAVAEAIAKEAFHNVSFFGGTYLELSNAVK
jgi:rhodanese-related sulfurtransferase